MSLTPERTLERDAALQGMLPHVPFDGWTKRALRAGLRDAGLQDTEALLLFPLGMLDLIEAYFDLTDRRMAEAAASVSETKLSARVRAIIALRLAQDRPHKEAVRRALAILALPRNAPTSAKCVFRTVDTIWRAAGDRSADFSWYTKRGSLAAIYSSTVLYWLRDGTSDDAETLSFLDRRLADIARTGRLSGRARNLLARARWNRTSLDYNQG
jgi:ubiquinone biosynthesis protein COQ9